MGDLSGNDDEKRGDQAPLYVYQHIYWNGWTCWRSKLYGYVGLYEIIIVMAITKKCLWLNTGNLHCFLICVLAIE